MFTIALYRQVATYSDVVLCPSRIVATMPASSSGDAMHIVMAVIDNAEVAHLDAMTSGFDTGRYGIDRLSLFRIPRAVGRWQPDYDAWLERFTAGAALDRVAPAGAGARAFPFLCKAGRISQEPIPEDVQQQHLAYVVGRAHSLLLGGWLTLHATLGNGEALPDVCGIFVYEGSAFDEVDRLAWQDPTVIERYWTPISFEPVCREVRC